MKSKLILLVILSAFLSTFFSGPSGCGGSQTVHLNAPPGGPIPASETDLAPAGLTGDWEVTHAEGRIVYEVLHIDGYEYSFVAVNDDESETVLFDGLFALHGQAIVFDPSESTPTPATFSLSGNVLILTFDGSTVTFGRSS